MTERIPEQPEENLPDWEELNDPNLDPGFREDLLGLAKIDEKEFWSDEGLARRLQEDKENTFAPSFWMGTLILLESHGLSKNKDVLDRFNALSDSFTGVKQRASIEEQVHDIQELKKYLLSLGISEKNVSGKETLHRAYWGRVAPGSEEALRILQNIAMENPNFRKKLEEFDREARERERGG
ncbi:MAG: hypothetical protein Q7R91_02525 [bacterium]|nr:hypothetical protein [bacterium]